MNHLELMDEACRFFQSHLSSKGREFLYSRYGLDEDTVNRARIGFAPRDRRLLSLHLLDKGYDIDDLLHSGLFEGIRYTLWGRRIMFPYIENGHVTYFIGRKLDGVTTDVKDGKYVKQFTCSEKNPHIIAKEPIFGIDSIRTGEVLVITEGITDAIICHQAGYPTISPVTVRFKGNCFDEVIAAIRSARKVVIIMDNEVNEAGLNGAIDTGMQLGSQGITCYIGTIPRPEDKEKVDLNDFLREGGDLSHLIEESILVELHPITYGKRKEEWKKGIDKMLSGMVREHRRTFAKTPNQKWINSGLTTEQKTAIVRPYLPSLSALTGIDNGLGPHPIHGSSTGHNLHVTGDLWHCFRNGNRGGGDIFTWIAVYELNLIHEGDVLQGADFAKTVQYCCDTYLPEEEKKKYF